MATVPQKHLEAPFTSGASILSHLDRQIGEAQAELAAAQAEEASLQQELADIEPHPHAHAWTQGAECLRSGLTGRDKVALAGLLSTRWPMALTAIGEKAPSGYLLDAFPAVLASDRDRYEQRGTAVLEDRELLTNGVLPKLMEEEAQFGLGSMFRIFGFHRRERLAWVGALCSSPRELSVEFKNLDASGQAMFGDALCAMAFDQWDRLDAIGQKELFERAKARDAARQESWAAMSADFHSENASWRGKPRSRRQRMLMHRIANATGLIIPPMIPRGTSADWIGAAGGNPRFSEK